MGSDSEILPPPASWEEFESLCHDLWKDIWRDDEAHKNGRKGQAQAGVDVYGRQDGKWIGIQCKQSGGAALAQRGPDDLAAEVSKALTFQPPLSHFILATTEPADARLQQRAREITAQHLQKGLFSVTVWAWRDIWHEIYQRKSLLARIGPHYWAGVWNTVRTASDAPVGMAPPLPSIFVGRSSDVAEIRRRLCVGMTSENSNKAGRMTVIRGWPGIGKTTLATALAHDEEIQRAFPDGVLWASLGEKPEALNQLRGWGHALTVKDILLQTDVEQCAARLGAVIRDKKLLLLIDDVWQQEHFLPFRIAGAKSSTLVTTRFPSVANSISPSEDQIYKLDVLAHEMGVKLMQTIAPAAVAIASHEVGELVKTLEGLPLAIRVAAQLIKSELQYGFDIKQFVAELQQAGRLLGETAPADRIDPQTGTIPTVTALLKKSTDRLDPTTRECFVLLGALKPDPLTYDIGALKALWNKDDPKPILKRLIDLGLLELVPTTGRYQLHSLLHHHARNMAEA